MSAHLHTANEAQLHSLCSGCERIERTRMDYKEDLCRSSFSSYTQGFSAYPLYDSAELKTSFHRVPWTRSEYALVVSKAEL